MKGEEKKVRGLSRLLWVVVGPYTLILFQFNWFFSHGPSLRPFSGLFVSFTYIFSGSVAPNSTLTNTALWICWFVYAAYFFNLLGSFGSFVA